MNEMEERIAVALKAELGRFSDPVHYYIRGEAQSRWRKNGEVGPEPDFDDIESYRIIARVAIEAIRYPTEAMTSAYYKLDAVSDDEPFNGPSPEAAWCAMIDAALK